MEEVLVVDQNIFDGQNELACRIICELDRVQGKETG
jgi:hypothetical protein